MESSIEPHRLIEIAKSKITNLPNAMIALGFFIMLVSEAATLARIFEGLSEQGGDGSGKDPMAGEGQPGTGVDSNAN